MIFKEKINDNELYVYLNGTDLQKVAEHWRIKSA